MLTRTYQLQSLYWGSVKVFLDTKGISNLGGYLCTPSASLLPDRLSVGFLIHGTVKTWQVAKELLVFHPVLDTVTHTASI